MSAKAFLIPKTLEKSYLVKIIGVVIKIAEPFPTWLLDESRSIAESRLGVHRLRQGSLERSERKLKFERKIRPRLCQLDEDFVFQ